MARFQPNQGPGVGAKVSEVTCPITLAVTASIGEVVQLVNSSAGPYTSGAAVSAPDTRGALLGVCHTAGVSGDEVMVTIEGLAQGLLSASVAVDALVTVDVNGAFLTAATTTAVRGRCLEAGDNGDVVLIDFSGDNVLGIVI